MPEWDRGEMTALRLVDSHCHLDFPDFRDDLDAVMARAREAGVETILTICTHITRFPQVLAVAERYDNVFCTVGIHPHEAAREPEVTAERLVDLSSHPKVVGFGETGLDFYYQHSPREDQERSFRIHIAAAREAGLPVVIHTRAADADTARILTEEQAAGPFAGVLHCFSATRELADDAVNMGLYVSFSGIVTFKKAVALREVAAALPQERLLVETDAPYLAPTPHRGGRNEPALVSFTATHIANLRGVEGKAFAAATTANFFTLFSKAVP